MRADDSITANFADAFASAIAGAGWHSVKSPEDAIQRWKSFSDDCLDGYPWDLEEYLSDINLRTCITKAATRTRESHPHLTSEFMDSIDDIDGSVQLVISREVFLKFPPSQWWLRNAPRYASAKFCRDFKDAYSIQLQPQSRYDADVKEMRKMSTAGNSIPDIFRAMTSGSWYVGGKAALTLRAGREAFDLDRNQKRTLWFWLHGELPDSQLDAELNR